MTNPLTSHAHMVSRERVLYMGLQVGYGEIGVPDPFFKAFYRNYIVPIPKQLSITSYEGSHELPTIQI